MLENIGGISYSTYHPLKLVTFPGAVGAECMVYGVQLWVRLILLTNTGDIILSLCATGSFFSVGGAMITTDIIELKTV